MAFYTHILLTLLFSLDGPSSRRNVLKQGVALATGVAVAGPTAANAYNVPDLPYPYEALEPYIDTPTMKLHHDKHHATYVANVNKAREGKPEVPILDLMADALEAGPAVRNNGGGHYNHAFFWDEMAPPDQAKKTKPSKQLEDLINKSFGSMDEMKSQFEARAAPGALFGSGWVWICVNKKGDELKLVGTPNQDNPLMKGVADEIMFPILGIDVVSFRRNITWWFRSVT
jgi:Fe-Mn family superoxide dismutase